MSRINIKDSDVYSEIMNDTTNKIIAIAYYVDNGLMITEENIEFIIDVEIMKYNKKIQMIEECGGDTSPYDNIANIINKNIISRIGKNKLETKFIYVNRVSIDVAISDIESSKNFYNWL